MKRSETVVFVALFTAAVLSAQPAGRRGGPPEGFGALGAAKGELSSACIEALGLTDAQKASLGTLRQDVATTLQPLFEQRRSYHDQIETALEAETPDPAAVGRLVIADHGIAGEIRAAHEQFLTRFQALLTPEQLTNFTALRDNGVCAPRRRGPR
jgi:Spy/CpxP family protein refolding chaperone